MTGKNVRGLIVASLVVTFGAGAISDDAQAARLGGGRSVGAQRQTATPLKQAAPSSQQQAQNVSGPSQAGGTNRWLAPLAGLAAGFGMGWLLSQGGFGGAVLMVVLAGLFMLMLARVLARPRAETPQSLYSGLGNETVAAPPPSQFLDGVPPNYRSQFVSSIPAGFDVDGFLKEAKRNFLRLQEANDRRDIGRLRKVTTKEMFEALKTDLAGAARVRQTDVVTINASLLEVVTETGLHWASVHFSGSIREDPRDAAHPFEEIWHLRKPADGSSGWLLAGIRQVV
jgi:predicted lipid-binding transport protein (Tim44 family)